MNNFFIVFFLVIFSNTLFAQSLEREVVASAGDYVQNTEGALSYAVGESTVVLGNNGVNFLTQGFQQPFSDPLIPVELGDFFAKKQDASVKFNWLTYSERNSLRFDIERSSDAKTFSKIGEVKALGQSAVRYDYDFLDKSPLDGVNYYRLRQIDFDGLAQVSKTISVYFDRDAKDKNWANVFPTMIHDNISIDCQFAFDAQLTVANILGMPVAYLNLPKSANVYQRSYDMKNLPNGTYFFIFKTMDTQIVQKAIKQ